MRIAVAQINTSVGDLEGNTQKIIAAIKTVEKKADLLVFPELSITGYPPQDLLLEKNFVEKNKEMLSKIARICTVPSIVGFVDTHGKNIYNAAALLQNKEAKVQHKMLLPNYDVFDEKRYFTPGTSQSLFQLHGKKIGIEICEDLWEQDYDVKPTSTLQKLGADILINISASPYCMGKLKERLSLAQEYNIPLFVYCNLVGGQDELVFDGQSLVLKEGTVIRIGKAFEEDLFIIDTEVMYPQINLKISEPEHLFKALILGLRDYCRKTQFEKVVIGMSGGIDSSLVCCLACESLGKENVVGIFMPSQYTSQESREDVNTLAEALGISFLTVPIHDIVDSYKKMLDPLFHKLPEDTTEENIQARIRGNLLMAFSNKFGHLVLAPGNKTELALGYCTLYGDMSGGLSVIGDISKMQVYELARYFNKVKGEEIIPERVFQKRPSAELKEGQVDPFDYAVVSPVVDLIIEEQTSRKELLARGYSPEVVDDSMRRIRRNEYKRRQAAPVIRVTKKAFGIGRRYPIASSWK
jgi:NAD+ synthase (glutamine-hydrolysing)